MGTLGAGSIGSKVDEHVGVGSGARRMHHDRMLVRSALFDFMRELSSAAIAWADECAQNEYSYDERHYDFKMGVLQGACDEAEWSDEMLALELTIVVQGR